MYDLPKKFNSDILLDCKHFNPWFDLCPTLLNSGLGPRLNNSDGMFHETAWYNTDQFLVSVIFHNRMKQYECLTTNYSMSSAAYVPYYVGLDVTRYLWDNDPSRRDFNSIDLVNFLRMRPEWTVRGGRDHFVVVGRTMWDFIRNSYKNRDWGSNFALLPEVKNMTTLSVEALQWAENDFGIPYPTYFHPLKEGDVISWQKKVRSMERPWLFSFVGAPRPEFPKMLIDNTYGISRKTLINFRFIYLKKGWWKEE
ncbi:hypothetical protein LUZ60_015280 [Juncus effusus]|nr:hypothetical protein LUZ60_015280 [Juncus effusus]